MTYFPPGERIAEPTVPLADSFSVFSQCYAQYPSEILTACVLLFALWPGVREHKAYVRRSLCDTVISGRCCPHCRTDEWSVVGSCHSGVWQTYYWVLNPMLSVSLLSVPYMNCTHLSCHFRPKVAPILVFTCCLSRRTHTYPLLTLRKLSHHICHCNFASVFWLHIHF